MKLLSAFDPRQKILAKHLYNYQKNLKKIEYDCLTPISRDSVSILKAGRGQCDHIAIVFSDVAKAMGLKSRKVVGFVLDTENGIDSEVHKVRPTFSNRHVWMEVEVPGYGWVELEANF
ncbi:MAG: transglutaminase-like domain-containing protein [Bdellovibrionota bacterium]